MMCTGLAMLAMLACMVGYHNVKPRHLVAAVSDHDSARGLHSGFPGCPSGCKGNGSFASVCSHGNEFTDCLLMLDGRCAGGHMYHGGG